MRKTRSSIGVLVTAITLVAPQILCAQAHDQKARGTEKYSDNKKGHRFPTGFTVQQTDDGVVVVNFDPKSSLREVLAITKALYHKDGKDLVMRNPTKKDKEALEALQKHNLVSVKNLGGHTYVVSVKDGFFVHGTRDAVIKKLRAHMNPGKAPRLILDREAKGGHAPE